MGEKTIDQNVSSTTGFVAICTILYPEKEYTQTCGHKMHTI